MTAFYTNYGFGVSFTTHNSIFFSHIGSWTSLFCLHNQHHIPCQGNSLIAHEILFSIMAAMLKESPGLSCCQNLMMSQSSQSFLIPKNKWIIQLFQNIWLKKE